MKKRNLLILNIFILLFIQACNSSMEYDLLLKNANIIDVTTGHILKSNIVINGNKIIEITDKKLPAKKQLDLQDKYIITGLWDMHAHIHKAPTNFLNELMSHGVMGIREMGTLDESKLDSLIYFKNMSGNQAPFIPQLEYAGYIHNGEECQVPEHKTIKSEDDIKKAIAYLKSIKARIFKIHNCFPPNLFLPLLELCKKENIKVAGHIPQGLDPLKEISNSRISSIEHISVIMRALVYRNELPAKGISGAAKILDGSYLDSLAINFSNNNIAFTPNLVSEENFIKSYPDDKKPLGIALLNKYKDFTKRLALNNVKLLAGTDLGLEGLEPGASLHRELELLVEAGLSPLEAIQTATINPVTYLYGTKNKNMIHKNAFANLVILKANPIDDIRNIREIFGVISYGKVKMNK